MTLSLPPVTEWNRTEVNRCTFDQILSYWEAHDILTFLVDLGIYKKTLHRFLDPHEREKERFFKPVISQQRFVVSRTILKHILHAILQTEKVSDICLIRKEDGRILVRDYPGVYISLSYSGAAVAITVGKRKIGSDLEGVRTIDIRKTRSYPLFTDTDCRNEEESNIHFFHVWTLVEAYAKLRDSNPYQFLTWKDLPRDAGFVSYCINHTLIFSLASGLDTGKDALLWLDTTPLGMSSCMTNTVPVLGSRGRQNKTVQ